MEENETNPSLLNSILGIFIGIYQTGLGFIQTFFGLAIVRFFYSIPIYIVWTFMVTSKINLPELSFVEIWAIFTAFDCARFDITKFTTSYQREEE